MGMKLPDNVETAHDMVELAVRAARLRGLSNTEAMEEAADTKSP